MEEKDINIEESETLNEAPEEETEEKNETETETSTEAEVEEADEISKLQSQIAILNDKYLRSVAFGGQLRYGRTVHAVPQSLRGRLYHR